MKMEKMRAERSGAEKVTVKVKVKNQQQEGRNDEASERISSEIEARRAKSEKKGERRRKERKSEQIGAWARERERENFWRFRLPLFFFPHPRSISFVSFNCSHPLHSLSVWLDTIQLVSSDLCCELTDELLSLVFF